MIDRRPKCGLPVAAGPQGTAVCQLEMGHLGPCDGGRKEREIASACVAYQLATYWGQP